jgi:hypothetical protein
MAKLDSVESARPGGNVMWPRVEALFAAVEALGR